MNESCHIWMLWWWWISHGTYEWVTSHMNESYHIWMLRDDSQGYSHIIYHWVTSHIAEPRHARACHVTYVFNGLLFPGRSHITYETSWHMWMGRVLYARVMPHMKYQSRTLQDVVTSYINETCHIWMKPIIYRWNLSHINESRDTFIRIYHISAKTTSGICNESCHTSTRPGRWHKCE